MTVFDTICVLVFEVYYCTAAGFDFMKRRRFLHGLTGTGGLVLAGCASLGEESDPFTFGITNWRNQRYLADIVLRENDESVLLDARVNIPAHQPTNEDPPGILIRDLTSVTDGDVINARVSIDEAEFETRYEVTCTHSENAENNLFFRIFSNEDREMQFSGSEC